MGVVDDGVPLGECAAPGVFTGQPHQFALVCQRGEGNELAPTPVDAALGDGLQAFLRNRCHPRVEGEALRRGGVGLADFLQLFPGDIGLESVRDFLGAGDALLLGKGLFLRVFDLVEHRFHLVVEVAGDLFGVFLGQVATAKEVLGVLLTNGLAAVDKLIHLGLGH